MAEGELLTIERVAALRRVELFRSVPGHTMVAVARLLEEVRFEAHDHVIERGAVEDWLFVVVSGLVRVHLGDRRLNDIGPGGVVGELAVLSPAARSASVTAVLPSLLLRLRRAPFEELLDDRPEIARAVISSLTQRLQALAADDAEIIHGGEIDHVPDSTSTADRR
jgi:CRP-like cAMP-binding protein